MKYKRNESICHVYWTKFLFLSGIIPLVLHGCSSPQQPNAYKCDYIGMSRRDVMISWCEYWRSESEARWVPWLKINLYYQEEDNHRALDSFVIIKLADFPQGKRRWLPLSQSIDDCFSKSPYVSDASKWSCFDRILTDYWPFDFKAPRERLSVWFDDNGVVTNQCVESYTVYY